MVSQQSYFLHSQTFLHLWKHFCSVERTSTVQLRLHFWLLSTLCLNDIKALSGTPVDALWYKEGNTTISQGISTPPLPSAHLETSCYMNKASPISLGPLGFLPFTVEWICNLNTPTRGKSNTFIFTYMLSVLIHFPRMKDEEIYRNSGSYYNTSKWLVINKYLLEMKNATTDTLVLEVTLYFICNISRQWFFSFLSFRTLIKIQVLAPITHIVKLAIHVKLPVQYPLTCSNWQ